MWFRNYGSPGVAMVLISICALASLYRFQYNAWRACATREPSVAEQFIAKYEPLGPLLPAGEVTCFIVDRQHADLERMEEEGRRYLAQYAVSPRLVGQWGDSPWVVVDSDCPDSVPKIAAADRWTLVADLRNGLRLYRTDGTE